MQDLMRGFNGLFTNGSTWPSMRLPENARRWLVLTLWETYAMDRMADGSRRRWWQAPLGFEENLELAVLRRRRREGTVA